ncbi:glycosyltransferase [Cohnella boryungensis]
MVEPLISLCMIVKDEADTLSRCLESVQGAADEIVIVDTGSTDETVAIARAFAAEVLHEPWNGDFAAARNKGLEAAKGKWILFLDADEALESTHRSELRQWAALEEYEGFFLQVRNYVGNGEQGATVNPILRLFRNRPEHRFQGRIHEQIAASIVKRSPGAPFHLTEIVIHHYGYQQAYVEAKDKVNRNMTLLQEAVAAEPDDPFYRYNLGVEYLRSGQPEQAFLHFRKASSAIDPLAVSYAHLLAKYEIRCKQALGQWEEALELARQALSLFPDYTDLWHVRAQCERALSRPGEAVASLLEAMKRGAPPPSYHTEEGIGTYQTAYLLGEVAEEQGDYEEALLWYKEAVNSCASLTPPLYRIFHLLRVTGREGDIPRRLAEDFRLTSDGAWAKIVAILLQCGCARAAADLLHHKRGRRLPEAMRRMALAEVELLRGDSRSARHKLTASFGKVREDKAKLQLGAFAEQLRWLSGGSGPWREPVARALAGDTDAENRMAAPMIWPQLGRLLAGSAAGGKREAFDRITELWLQLLEQPDSRPEGADALALRLSALADRHLGAVVGAEGGMRDEALAATRLRLPTEDGL